MSKHIVSPLDLKGSVVTSRMSVVLKEEMEVVVGECMDGPDSQKCEFGFVTPEGLVFSFSASDEDELSIDFFLKGGSKDHCFVGDLPHDCLGIENIPGFKKYLEINGYSAENIMENVVSVRINKNCTKSFTSIHEVVDHLSELIHNVKGTIVNHKTDGSIGSEEFDDLEENFKNNTSLLDE